MAKLLANYPSLKLRIWKIQGKLEAFTSDLIASDKTKRPAFGEKKPTPAAAAG
jgi:hypothetical protein